MNRKSGRLIASRKSTCTQCHQLFRADTTSSPCCPECEDTDPLMALPSVEYLEASSEDGEDSIPPPKVALGTRGVRIVDDDEVRREEIVCDLCNKKFKSLAAKSYHVKNAVCQKFKSAPTKRADAGAADLSSNEEEDAAPPFKRARRGVAAADEQEQESLEEIHCDWCNKKFKSLNAKSYHVKNKVCMKSKSPAQTRRVATVDASSGDEDGPAGRSSRDPGTPLALSCDICNKKFKSTNAKSYHMKNAVCQKPTAIVAAHRVETIDLTEEDIRKRRTPVQCPNCLKIMFSKTAYFYHMNNNVCGNMKEKNASLESKRRRKQAAREARQARKARQPTTPAPRVWMSASERREHLSSTPLAAPKSLYGVRYNPRMRIKAASKAAKARLKWTSSNVSEVATEAMLTRIVCPETVILDLLEDMWDFSRVVSLPDWVQDYLDSSCKIDEHLIVDLWPLTPVDLGVAETDDAESFATLDDRIEARSSYGSAKIQPFHALPTDECGREGGLEEDILINAGGSVWSTMFAPKSIVHGATNDDLTKRFFCVGVSRIGFPNARYPYTNVDKECMLDGGSGPGFSIPQRLSRPQTHDNLLQIWGTSLGMRPSCDENDCSGTNTTMTELVYCIELKGSGAVFRTEWSSTLFSPCEDNVCDDIDIEREALGLLAAVCEDGSCRIFLPPSEYVVSAFSPTEVSRASPRSPYPRVPVLQEESVCRCRLSTASPILCVNWSPREALTLCCGHADGSISVWKLNSILDKQKGPGILELKRPAIRLADSSTAMIRGVSFCPYRDNLVLSVGNDMKSKVWRLPTTSRAIHTLATTGLWSCDVTWDPFGNGFFVANSENPTVTFEPLWSDIPKTNSVIFRHFAADAAIWGMDLFVPSSDRGCSSVAACDREDIGSPQMATVSSDGTVRLTNIPMCAIMHRDRRFPIALRMFRMHRVVNKDCGDEDTSSSSSSGKSSTVIFSTSQEASNGIQDPEYRICLPGVAMQSIDSCSIPHHHGDKSSTDNDENEEQYRRRLFVYGGSVGLIRIHAVDLPWL